MAKIVDDARMMVRLEPGRKERLEEVANQTQPVGAEGPKEAEATPPVVPGKRFDHRRSPKSPLRLTDGEADKIPDPNSREFGD